SRGRREGSGQAPRIEGAAAWRGRARIAVGALPGGGGSRQDWAGGLRRGRSLQSAAADYSHHRSSRDAENGIGTETDQRAESGREGDSSRHAPHVGKRDGHNQGL